MKTRWLLVVALCGAAGSLQAQAPTRIDRIVAVVGEIAIPESRLNEQLFVLRRQEGFPTDSAAVERIRYGLLNRLIENELLMQVADQDTAINISEEQIQQAAERSLRATREQFGSIEEYERELRAIGMTSADEHRRFETERIRVEMTTEALKSYLSQTGALRNIPPTETEMRAFFDQQVASGALQERPPTVTFRQIVVRPEADSANIREAFARADSALTRVRGGEDFATVAQEVSQDPGSKERGGSLGWQRRGGLDPIFEDMAFRLRPGQISPIVPTQFGFHVIQVQRIDAAEILVRHILTIPEITEQNLEDARAVAESVTIALRNGASFDSLVTEHHDRDEETLHARVLREQLPPAYAEPLADAQPGDVFGPVTLPAPTGSKYGTLLFESETTTGEYTFEELRDRIREILTGENGFQRYVDELKSGTFIDIRIPAPEGVEQRGAVPGR